MDDEPSDPRDEPAELEPLDVGDGGAASDRGQIAPVEITPAARELIAREGHDPVYGARPLRRFISHGVETRIGRALLTGDIHDDATITLDAVDGELVVRWANHAPSTEPEPDPEPEPAGTPG